MRRSWQAWIQDMGYIWMLQRPLMCQQPNRARYIGWALLATAVGSKLPIL